MSHYYDSLASSIYYKEPLSLRLPKELGCAVAASFLVSPVVAILDKAMVKEISGVEGFLREIKMSSSEMIFKPNKFFGGLPFRLTFIVYAATYSVANCSEIVLDHFRLAEAQKRSPVKVGLSSSVNISLLMWRDSIFARHYTGVSRTPTPLRTMGLFGVRDTATMAATFFVAPRAAEYLYWQCGVNREVASISSALIVPGLTQILTAPLHIHALDHYVRPTASWKQSWARIGEEFKKIAFARTLRVLPAFGLGSYSNSKFREMVISDQNFRMSLKIRRQITIADAVLADAMYVPRKDP